MPERYATRRVYAAAMALAALPFALVIGFMFLFIAPEEGYHWPGGVVFSTMVFITFIPAGLFGLLLWPTGSRSRKRMKWTGLAVTVAAVFSGSFLLGVLLVVTDGGSPTIATALLFPPLAGITGPFFVNFLTLGLHWPAGIVTSLLFRA